MMDVEMVSLKPVASEDDVELEISKRGPVSDSVKSFSPTLAARIASPILIAGSLFLTLFILSPKTVTRDGLFHAAVILITTCLSLLFVVSAIDRCLEFRRGRSEGGDCSARRVTRATFRCAYYCTVYGLCTLALFVIVLWIIRAANKTHLDDVHPLLSCEVQHTLIERSQLVTLWIIPFQEEQGISDFPQWCAEMKAYEKLGKVRLGMHGVRHLIDPYEFECTAEHCFENVTEALLEGVAEWERAFNETPKLFAAPGGFVSSDTASVARSDVFHFDLRTIIDGLFQRIYHCDDSFCSTPGGFLCTTEALDIF